MLICYYWTIFLFDFIFFLLLSALVVLALLILFELLLYTFCASWSSFYFFCSIAFFLRKVESANVVFFVFAFGAPHFRRYMSSATFLAT